MDALWAEVVFYGPFAVMAGMGVLAGLIAYTAWRRAWAIDTLPLDEMLARQGVHVPRDVTPGMAYELAHAARRCAACGARDTCRKWLDSNARSGAEEFCPNHAFMERAKQDRMPLGASAL